MWLAGIIVDGDAACCVVDVAESVDGDAACCVVVVAEGEDGGLGEVVLREELPVCRLHGDGGGDEVSERCIQIGL